MTILCILKSGSYPDETNIFLGWQKKNTPRTDLEPSIWPQCVADLDPWYKLVYHLGIQKQKYLTFQP